MSVDKVQEQPAVVVERPRETTDQILARVRAALGELNQYRFQHMGSDYCPRCGNRMSRKASNSMKWQCRDRLVPFTGNIEKGCNYQRG